MGKAFSQILLLAATMYTLNIYYRQLTKPLEITIQQVDVIEIENTLESGMYLPCQDIERHEPNVRTETNAFRIFSVIKLQTAIRKWKESQKLWQVHKNQKGIQQKIDVDVAIVLFEICEASNNEHLVVLKSTIWGSLKKNYNIELPITKLITR